MVLHSNKLYAKCFSALHLAGEGVQSGCGCAWKHRFLCTKVVWMLGLASLWLPQAGFCPSGVGTNLENPLFLLLLNLANPVGDLSDS